ncbi:DoxX family protein [Paenibacillus protaetiae]|uniref:DoxX family protein n=1 Tax=Paenibacillus protaetiae TaxID=2509456 RepID=A0A4P6EXW4_9BACL|nr:DoxX family protein [Paenibacillus protaetiae]QAY67914.1 DoxX family protein [Paenibacillus protaetiae]
MNIAVWIIQGLLAFMFIMAGMMKTVQYEKAKASQPWMKESSKGLVNFIGAVELLGGIGLILPQATGVIPSLTPIAAIGIAAIMLLAAVFHARRAEYSGIMMNIILLALAVFVAVYRF